MTEVTATKITINQEYADLVPPLSAEEYESLKQSIKQNGLWVPITVNSQSVILDGHHRFKACQEIAIEPKRVTKDFPDKLHEQIFVIDSNLQRRHLNNFQRTELALKSKSILEEIAKCNSRSNLKQQQQLHENVPTDRNLTVGSAGESAAHSMIGGRVDEQIAKKAGVSHDTVRKVEAIQEAVQQNPNLNYLVERARRGEMSVNEADELVKYSEDQEIESEKQSKWRKIREQVLKEDDYKCRNCGDEFHLDVYPISDVFEDKHIPENLETLCKDCHNIKKKFFGEFGLVNSFVYMFQELTGMSGKRYFQYNTIGSLDSKKESNDYMRKWLEESEKNPYSKLKKSSYAELVSKTRGVRERLIQRMPLGDYSVYITQQVLSQLLPVLRDYQEIIDKEADARRKKDEMSKR